ncbi:MAG: hypothetical protein ACI9W2_003433 [Gammaproteobacteria bacterium]|jgi:hypothetical protein
MRAREVFSARASEGQLQETLSKRQMLSLLNYVLIRSADQDLVVDERLTTLTRLRAEEGNAEAAENTALEVLRQLLTQVGMTIVIAESDEAQSEASTANSVEATNEVQFSRVPQLFNPSMSEREVSLNGYTYKVQIWPANARPNLNRVALEPLANYLQTMSFSEPSAQSLAAILIDWVDRDTVRSESGAEFESYLKFGFGPRGAAFRSWAEVSYALQVTPAVIRELRQGFVLHGDDKRTLRRYLDAPRLAALAGVEEEDAEVALTDVDWQEKLALETVNAIEAATTDQAEEKLWLIRISLDSSSLQAVVDLESKEILDLTLDGIGPVGDEKVARVAAEQGVPANVLEGVAHGDRARGIAPIDHGNGEPPVKAVVPGKP